MDSVPAGGWLDGALGVFAGLEVLRGYAGRGRPKVGLRLVESARVDGADSAAVAHVRALLQSAGHAPDRLYRLQRLVPKLVPGFFRSPRWVSVVGWLMVLGAVVSVVFGALGIALGGYLYQRHDITLVLDGMNPASLVLLVSAALTTALAVPAMIGRRRDPDAVWPLRWLRNAALIFTFLNALVDFATEGFGALLNMSIGLFTLAVLSYQLDAREAAADAERISGAG